MINALGLLEVDGMAPMDALLKAFATQKRMKLSADDYEPCYRIVGESDA